MLYENVAGRTKEDLEKYGNVATGYIGKHIVGEGDDAHVTTPVLLDFLRPHIMLITGKRGTGKCLSGDTLITMDNGLILPIKDLAENSQLVACLDDNLKMTLSNKTNFYKRKAETLLKVKLRSGREIKLTPEHPLLTIQGWKPICELNLGSRIATPRKL